MSRPQQVPAHSKEILHDAVYGREALYVGGRLEAPHLPFALARRLMGDFGSIVRVLAVQDRVISLSGGVRECGLDVIGLEIGEVTQDLVIRGRWCGRHVEVRVQERCGTFRVVRCLLCARRSA